MVTEVVRTSAPAVMPSPEPSNTQPTSVSSRFSAFSRVSRLLIQLVLLYRVTLGRLLGGHCRYYPSCSQYAIDAVNKHGPARGSWRAAKRGSWGRISA